MNETPAAALPHVAIVGRPNVGKSTLFNRIVGRREAIVGSEYGMTRDRHTAETDWAGRDFGLTDTGGIEHGTADELLLRVERQVMAAIDVADVALLIVDGREGPLPVDHEVAAQLRRSDIPFIVVINKCDTPSVAESVEAEFFEFGGAPLHTVSAEHGLGVNDLLDTVIDLLPVSVARPEDDADRPTRVAVVGRPNVGKSSLVNALLGSDRVIVGDRPGTTRDAIDTPLESGGKRYVLIDTAGIRKRARIDTHAEMASVAMARRRLRHADVALLVIDPHDGVTRQDMHVASEADELGCGLIVVINKWDTIEKQDNLKVAMERYVIEKLGRIRYAEVALTSATEGWGVGDLLPLVDKVAAARGRRVPTSELNRAFEIMVSRHAPAGGTSAAQPKYLTQVGVNPPRFVAFAGGRGSGRRDYRRYLENRLRDAFDFRGTPLVIKLRRSRRRRAARHG